MTLYRRISWILVLLLLAGISTANFFKITVVQGTLCSLGIGPVSVNCPIGTAQVILGLKQVSPELLLFVVLPLLTFVLFGRGFCGWVCPQGAPAEWGARLHMRSRKKLVLPPLPATRRRGRILLLVIFGGGLAGSFFLGIPVFCYICPVGAICRGIVGGAIGHTLGAEILVAGMILLVEITLAQRGYCRYICPIGALGSLLYFKNTLRVHRNPGQCGKCGTCMTVCSMGNSPMNDLTFPTCVNCGSCVEHCPNNALALTRKGA